MKKNILLLLTVLSFVFISLFSISRVFAQFEVPTSSPGFQTDGKLYMYEIQDPLAKEGDIVVASDSGLLRAEIEAADNIFGVIAPVSSGAFPFVKNGEHPVARTGVVNVNVTNINGSINYGDLITSSVIAGKGQKAAKSEFVIGYALEGLNNQNSGDFTYQGKLIKVGSIKVALLVHYYQINQPVSFFAMINKKIFPFINPSEGTVKIMRVFTAVIICLIGFIISYFTFARSILKASQAIKRNPAVKHRIRFNLVINTILSILLVLMAVAASILILRL